MLHFFTVRAHSQESVAAVSPLWLFRRCGKKQLVRASPYSIEERLVARYV
jgi:hypothetical protein